MSIQDNKIFEDRLDEALIKMQLCQKEHNVESCSHCDKFIGCTIRTSYVQSVYDSMSKGKTGGFEF